MTYKHIYQTPEGFSNMIMNSDGEYLTGLWFEGSRDTSKHKINCEEKDLPIFSQTSEWLDTYFKGQVPDFIPKYKIENMTPFRQEVIDIMNSIPFGKTLTYNDIAKIIAKNRVIKRMSSQAVRRRCWLESNLYYYSLPQSSWYQWKFNRIWRRNKK